MKVFLRSKLYLLLIIVSIQCLIYANEVPESRTIYIYAPFYFDFGDQGEEILDKLVRKYHNYKLYDRHIEKNEPKPSPQNTSLFKFISQLKSVVSPCGIVLIDSHGDIGWLAVEAYSDKTVRDNKIVEYINSGIPSSDIGDRIVPGKAPYVVVVSANYISNHTTHMGNKSIVFGNFCYSSSLAEAFIKGGWVYNYFGFDRSVTLNEGLSSVNTLFKRLGGEIEQKRNYTVEEAMSGMPSYLQHFPKNDNAKKEVIYNSPKILQLKIAQDGKTIYDYSYSDLTYPFVDAPYPGDLSSCSKNPAKPGDISIRIRFSETMDNGTMQTVVRYDPQGENRGAGPVSFYEGRWSTTYFDNDTYEAKAKIPADLYGEIAGHATLIVRARDIFLSDASSINPDGELDTDGDGQWNGLDKQHIFRIVNLSTDVVISARKEYHKVEEYFGVVDEEDEYYDYPIDSLGQEFTGDIYCTGYGMYQSETFPGIGYDDPGRWYEITNVYMEVEKYRIEVSSMTRWGFSLIDCKGGHGVKYQGGPYDMIDEEPSDCRIDITLDVDFRDKEEKLLGHYSGDIFSYTKRENLELWLWDKENGGYDIFGGIIPNPNFKPQEEGLKLKDATVGKLAILSGVNNTAAITNVGVSIGSYVFRTARGPDMYAKIAINGVDFYQK